MAAISIYFRNGDYVTLGSSLELANQAYEKIITTKLDFVDLSSVKGFPRVAIRADDIISVFFNPLDTTSNVWYSAALRSNSETLRYQLRLRKLSPGPPWPSPIDQQPQADKGLQEPPPTANGNL